MDKKTLTEEDVLFVRGICRKSFEKNSDLANDCFLYVWEKLHEDDSRRVRAFKGEASLHTFLYSVTSKLIIDFRRTRFGYKVLPKYFWEFDEVNQYIFRLFFYQNLTPAWAENAVRAEFKISEEEAQKRVDEVEKRVRDSRVRMDSPAERGAVLLGEGVGDIASEDKGGNPEESMIAAETQKKRGRVLEALKKEVQKLEVEDALILQLYFEQGLTAKEISGVISGVKDKSVYKRIEKVINSLRKDLKEKGVTEEDIKDIFECLL